MIPLRVNQVRRPILAYIAAVITFIIFAVAISNWWQGRKGKKDAVIGSKIEGLQLKDSSNIAGFNAVNRKVDSLTAELQTQSGRIDTVIRKVAVRVKVPVPGTPDTIIRIDSVFKDSLFARLSDSSKVELLRLLAAKQSRTCSALALTCQQARDSAKQAFKDKDDLINLWHMRYDNKPRRRCGLGSTVGVIGGVSSTLQPIAGLGVAAGFTCNF